MSLTDVRGLPLLLLLLTAGPSATAQTFQELLRNGLLALQQNDLASAETNLQGAATLQPANARAWVALAQTFWKRNEAAKAEDAARKASEFAGKDSAVLRSLVIYYSESSQALRAAEAQARFAEANPADIAAYDRAVSLYFEAAQPLLQVQKFSEVITMLGDSAPVVKKSAQIQMALGVAYYGLRRFEESFAAFSSVIAMDPALKQPYLFLGKMLDQIPSHLEAATRLLINFETSNPTDFEGYLLHAKVLNARAVEPEATRKLLDKVILMQPGSADAHFELGCLLDRTQHFTEAALEFEYAKTLNPSDPATHYRLSRLYQRLNKPEAARAEREQHRKLVAAQNAAR